MSQNPFHAAPGGQPDVGLGVLIRRVGTADILSGAVIVVRASVIVPLLYGVGERLRGVEPAHCVDGVLHYWITPDMLGIGISLDHPLWMDRMVVAVFGSEVKVMLLRAPSYGPAGLSPMLTGI